MLERIEPEKLNISDVYRSSVAGDMTSVRIIRIPVAGSQFGPGLWHCLALNYSCLVYSGYSNSSNKHRPAPEENAPGPLWGVLESPAIRPDFPDR